MNALQGTLLKLWHNQTTMSEHRDAQAAVDALDAQISSLRSVPTTPLALGDDAAVDMLRLTVDAVTVAVEGELQVTIEKFRERTKMVDPVTNEPRFGPKTMAKVVEMLTTYDALYEEVMDSGLLASLRAQIAAYDAEQVNQELQNQAAQSAIEHAQKLREQQEQQHMERETRMQQQREREAEQRRVVELARLAQAKREERERERLAEEARLREEQEQLARQNATATVGVDGLHEGLERLRASTPGQHEWRQAVQKLLAIVTNICASPENSNFRQIPKTNAHFHQDIGQYDGGYACLLALGFKELEPEPEKRVFVMEEPDLSEDFDKWSNWFDGLKEMKAWLETQLAQR